jgi:hypothetical protein
MGPTRAHKASWLALLLTFVTTVIAQSSSSWSASSSRTTSRSTMTTSSEKPWWTYTSRLMKSTSTSMYTYTFRTGESVTGYKETITRTVKTGVTPTATPYSTSTYMSGGSYYYDNGYSLEIVYALYSQGAVPESDLEEERTTIGNDYDATTTRTSSTTTSTSVAYEMPVTWTAPASCTSTSFSIVGTATPSIPSQVRDQLKPTSKYTVSTQSYTQTYGNYAYATETWYLTAGAAPSTNDYYYRSYVAQCSAPPIQRSTSGGDGSYRNYGDIDVCSWYSGCTPFRVWIIVIATIIPGIFLLGFLESYFWFRRLMLGKGCLRAGTVCWVFLFIWVACFTRSQSRRSKEDQVVLREKWKQTSVGQAFKLWIKWGFRHAYPVPLLGQYSRNTVGIVPEGQPLPQMGQANSGFQAVPGVPGIIYHNGQAYYAPPPPGTAYMPPQNPGHYTEHFAPAAPMQTKEAHVSVSPLQDHAVPRPIPSPVSPPAQHAEAYAPPVQQPDHLPPGALPTMSGAQPAPEAPQGVPPPGPPTPRPT